MDLRPGKKQRQRSRHRREENNTREREDEPEVDLVTLGHGSSDAYDRYQNEMYDYMRRLGMARQGAGYVEPVGQTETDASYRQQSAPHCGVMTEAPRAAAAPPIEEEDAVVIVCGRCKQTFSDTKLFLRHKVQEYECLAVGQQHQDLVISSATQQQMRQKSADAPDANKSGYLQSPTNNFQVKPSFTQADSTGFTNASADFLNDADPLYDQQIRDVLGSPENLQQRSRQSAATSPSSCYTKIVENSDPRLTPNPENESGYEYYAAQNQGQFDTGVEEEHSSEANEAPSEHAMGPPERTVSGSVNAAFLDEMNRPLQLDEPSVDQPEYQDDKPATPAFARAREIQQVGAGIDLAQQSQANPQLQQQGQLSPQNYAGPWLSTAQRESLQRAMSFNDQGQAMVLGSSSGGASPVKSPGSAGTPRSAAEVVARTMPSSADDWFTEEEREHIPSLLGLGEYIGPGSSWKTPIALNPGTGIVLSGKFLPAGSSRYEKHFSFGLDLWDMTLPFSSSNVRQRALYMNPIFSTKEIQIGSLIDDEFVGVRHVAEGDKFPFKPGGKFTFAILCRDKGFKIWWKGTRGEGGTIYNYQYDVDKIKYLRVYDCHAIYIALGFRF